MGLKSEFPLDVQESKKCLSIFNDWAIVLRTLVPILWSSLNSLSKLSLKSFNSSMLIFAGILSEYVSSIIGPWCQNSLRSATLSPTAVSMPKGV